MTGPIPTQPIPPSLEQAFVLLDTALLRDDVPLHVQLDLADVYSDVVGPGFQTAGSPGLSRQELTTMSLWARSCTIWGGSSEVPRPVVAERVLGLPR